MPNIRQATKNDASSLALLAEDTFREAFLIDNSSSDIDQHCLNNFSVEQQREEILNVNIITLVAEVESKLVAFAQLKLNSSTKCINTNKPAELYRLYVSSDKQGTGLAQQIMQLILNKALANHSDCVWLGVWEHNPKAISFYQKYGFSTVGEHVFTLGGDPQRDLIMSLNNLELSTEAK